MLDVLTNFLVKSDLNQRGDESVDCSAVLLLLQNLGHFLQLDCSEMKMSPSSEEVLLSSGDHSFLDGFDHCRIEVLLLETDQDFSESVGSEKIFGSLKFGVFD